MKYLTSDPERPAAKGKADKQPAGRVLSLKACALEIPVMMWPAKSCNESLNLGGVRQGNKKKCNLAATFSIEFTIRITKTRHHSSN